MAAFRPRRGGALVLLALLSVVCLTGCFGTTRQLKVTEVSTDKIELFLDEPPSNRMTLQDHELLVTAATTAGGTGPTTRLSLSPLGRSLVGGELVVIWEEAGYNGAPMAADFVTPAGDVPGIKVKRNFFASLQGAEAVDVRVRGRHDRGMVYDRSDDCIRYGVLT